jgi:ABC-2 type transport system permease protein
MNISTLTIAQRIINQLIHDRRTLGLLVIAPLVIVSLIGVSIPDKSALNYTAPAILAVLIIFFGFLLTGISFFRERSQGTLERLMASPVTRLDIVGGYLLGFLGFALLQTLIIFFYMIYVLDISYHGELWQILIFQVLIGIGAVCLGTFLSVFARNEFQMIQFIPLIVVPQIILCGLLWPIEQMPTYLEWLAKCLPMTYGVEGIRAMMIEGAGLLDIGKDVGVLAGYAVGLLLLASLTLKRSSAA